MIRTTRRDSRRTLALHLTICGLVLTGPDPRLTAQEAPATPPATAPDTTAPAPATPADAPTETPSPDTPATDSSPATPADSPVADAPASEPPANPPTPAAVTPPPAPAPSVPAGPRRAEFDQIFSQWKTLLKELRDLQERFTIADDSETDEIRAEFLTKIERGKAMVPQLRAAALQAYAENPLGDRELSRFLVKLAAEDIAGDRYEAAQEITQTMLDHQTDEKTIYDLAGTAAYALHDFAAAEKHLKEAESYGVLDKGKDFLPMAAELGPLWQAELAIREQEAAADDLPRVRLTTSKGELVVELFENEAPQTVGNFIGLVKKGFYDGLTFHRVLPNFMAQGGCPRGDGSSGPGYNIYDECFVPNHRNHFRGSLSMAKTAARNTGGSQFFINFVPTPHLNGQHTVFGRVVEGWDVLEKLQRRNPDEPTQANLVPDKIVKAEVIRDRGHVYEPTPVE